MNAPAHRKPFLVVYLLLTVALAQAGSTALAQPIVAFTGRDSDSPDEFAFVALVDLPANTEFYVTNQNWDNLNGLFSDTGEGTLLFEATATIARGTVVQVRIIDTSTNTFEITGAAATATFFPGPNWTPTSADPHYAFNSSNPTDPLSNVDEIYAAFLTEQVAGDEIDPSTGTNASPEAIVVDFRATQPSGIDYSANRAAATLTTLADLGSYTTGAGAITLDLSPFFGATIFSNGFESGNTSAWSTTVP